MYITNMYLCIFIFQNMNIASTVDSSQCSSWISILYFYISLKLYVNVKIKIVSLWPICDFQFEYFVQCFNSPIVIHVEDKKTKPSSVQQDVWQFQIPLPYEKKELGKLFYWVVFIKTTSAEEKWGKKLWIWNKVCSGVWCKTYIEQGQFGVSYLHTKATVRPRVIVPSGGPPFSLYRVSW